MNLKGNTVTPDKRKGLVYIQQSDDSLIHFCWKDRTTGNVDDVSHPETIECLCFLMFTGWSSERPAHVGASFPHFSVHRFHKAEIPP